MKAPEWPESPRPLLPLPNFSLEARGSGDVGGALQTDAGPASGRSAAAALAASNDTDRPSASPLSRPSHLGSLQPTYLHDSTDFLIDSRRKISCPTHVVVLASSLLVMGILVAVLVPTCTAIGCGMSSSKATTPTFQPATGAGLTPHMAFDALLQIQWPTNAASSPASTTTACESLVGPDTASPQRAQLLSRLGSSLQAALAELGAAGLGVAATDVACRAAEAAAGAPAAPPPSSHHTARRLLVDATDGGLAVELSVGFQVTLPGGSGPDLAAAVRNVAAGEPAVSTVIQRRLAEGLQEAGGGPSTGIQLLRLTAAESGDGTPPPSAGPAGTPPPAIVSTPPPSVVPAQLPPAAAPSPPAPLPASPPAVPPPVPQPRPAPSGTEQARPPSPEPRQPPPWPWPPSPRPPAPAPAPPAPAPPTPAPPSPAPPSPASPAPASASPPPAVLLAPPASPDRQPSPPSPPLPPVPSLPSPPPVPPLPSLPSPPSLPSQTPPPPPPPAAPPLPAPPGVPAPSPVQPPSPEPSPPPAPAPSPPMSPAPEGQQPPATPPSTQPQEPPEPTTQTTSASLPSPPAQPSADSPPPAPQG